MATKKNNTAENEAFAEKDLAAENEAQKAELEALKAELEALKKKQQAEVSAETGRPKKAEASAETGPKMVKIRIPRTKADEEDVFVSVNLRTYQIKRGEEVEVPDFVAEVLRHQEEMLEEIMLYEKKVRK